MLATEILDRLCGYAVGADDPAMRWDVRVEVMADEVGSATGRGMTLDVIAAADGDGRLTLICDNHDRRRSGHWGYNELACMLRGKGRGGREVSILVPLGSATFTDLGSTGMLELSPASVTVDQRSGVMTISVEDMGSGVDANGDERPASYASRRVRPLGRPQRKARRLSA